jgi:hypothetical protein
MIKQKSEYKSDSNTVLVMLIGGASLGNNLFPGVAGGVTGGFLGLLFGIWLYAKDHEMIGNKNK